MKEFWKGMVIERVLRKKEDLMLQGKDCFGKKIEFPLAQKFILEREGSDFSKDLKLKTGGVNKLYLEENLLAKFMLLGIKHDEIVQIALPSGWCWDEA